MSYSKKFLAKPGSITQLKNIDSSYTGKKQNKKSAIHKIRKLQKKMDELQFKLYSEQKRSLLICLQGPDAAGKDGVIRHVISSMNPQGCRVVGFRSNPHRRTLLMTFSGVLNIHHPGAER